MIEWPRNLSRPLEVSAPIDSCDWNEEALLQVNPPSVEDDVRRVRFSFLLYFVRFDLFLSFSALFFYSI